MKKLSGKNFIELSKDLLEAKKGQDNCHSDMFWWSWQKTIEQIEEAQLELMKKEVEILLERYGYNAVGKYINNVVAVAKKEKELEEAKSKL